MWILDRTPHKAGDDRSDWIAWIKNEDRYVLIQIGSAGLDQEGAAYMVSAMIGGLNATEQRRIALTAAKHKVA